MLHTQNIENQWKFSPQAFLAQGTIKEAYTMPITCKVDLSAPARSASSQSEQKNKSQAAFGRSMMATRRMSAALARVAARHHHTKSRTLASEISFPPRPRVSSTCIVLTMWHTFTSFHVVTSVYCTARQRPFNFSTEQRPLAEASSRTALEESMLQTSNK